MTFSGEQNPHGNQNMQGDSNLLRYINQQNGRNDVVFSANQRYNPTSLAIESSLKEIFDEFEFLVTYELRRNHSEGNEQTPL